MNTPLVLKKQNNNRNQLPRAWEIPVDSCRLDKDSAGIRRSWIKKELWIKLLGKQEIPPNPGHRYQLLLVSREVTRKRIELRITLSYGPFLLIIKLPKRPLTANRPGPGSPAVETFLVQPIVSHWSVWACQGSKTCLGINGHSFKVTALSTRGPRW